VRSQAEPGNEVLRGKLNRSVSEVESLLTLRVGVVIYLVLRNPLRHRKRSWRLHGSRRCISRSRR